MNWVLILIISTNTGLTSQQIPMTTKSRCLNEAAKYNSVVINNRHSVVIYDALCIDRGAQS